MLRIFLSWRIGLFAVAYLSSLVFTKVQNGGPGAVSPDTPYNYWLSWAQWDGGHYLSIISNGYQLPSDSAFFPLYPALVKLLGPFFSGNFLISGLAVANIAFALFLVVLSRLPTDRASKPGRQNTIFAYIFYPAAFFAVSFYSEGLYLLVSTAAFLFYFKNKYATAFFLAGVASVTRPFGILLIISLLTSYVFCNLKGSISQLLFSVLKYLLLCTFLPFLYFQFLSLKFGSPLIFFSVQSMWGREAADPISTFLRYIIPILTLQSRPLMDYFDILVFASFLLVLILGAKKLKTAYWIYSMLVILIPASTGTLSSIPRYSLSSIGVFILIANYVTLHPKFKPVLFTGFLAVQVFLLVRFINGYWAG